MWSTTQTALSLGDEDAYRGSFLKNVTSGASSAMKSVKSGARMVNLADSEHLTLHKVMQAREILTSACGKDDAKMIEVELLLPKALNLPLPGTQLYFEKSEQVVKEIPIGLGFEMNEFAVVRSIHKSSHMVVAKKGTSSLQGLFLGDEVQCMQIGPGVLKPMSNEKVIATFKEHHDKMKTFIENKDKQGYAAYAKEKGNIRLVIKRKPLEYDQTAINKISSLRISQSANSEAIQPFNDDLERQASSFKLGPYFKEFSSTSTVSDLENLLKQATSMVTSNEMMGTSELRKQALQIATMLMRNYQSNIKKQVQFNTENMLRIDKETLNVTHDGVEWSVVEINKVNDKCELQQYIRKFVGNDPMAQYAVVLEPLQSKPAWDTLKKMNAEFNQIVKTCDLQPVPAGEKQTTNEVPPTVSQPARSLDSAKDSSLSDIVAQSARPDIAQPAATPKATTLAPQWSAQLPPPSSPEAIAPEATKKANESEQPSAAEPTWLPSWLPFSTTASPSQK